ncbi:MAG: nickel-dependent lactate racemase [Chloroflexi bacterium]|nr:nickel-dependent lactate racemase [Chloroflexota bacterium]
MSQQRFRIPFGRGHVTFDVPPTMRGWVAESQPMTPLPDLEAATRAAIAAPVGSLPLRDLARPGDTVCLVVTDATRACPDHALAPPILAELAAAGVRDKDITILVACGLHRASTPGEKVEKLGAAVVQRYRVVDHDALDTAALVDLGTFAADIPGVVSRLVVDADLVIATGVVEPHQYAGYSGGGKTVAVGCGGEAVIGVSHGVTLLDDPGTRLGNLTGNRFHEAAFAIAERAGLRFIVNVVLDDEARAVAVRAGAMRPAYQELVAVARTLVEAPVDRQFDVVVAGVGYPKDANLYQASRAASYIFFAPKPIVRPGGAIIVPAACPEGPGAGLGERRFYEAMCAAPDMVTLLDDARRHGLRPGESRAFVMAKVMRDVEVIVAGADDPAMIRRAQMTAAPDVPAALAQVAGRLGPELDVLVVPHALLTLPALTRQPASV